MSQPAEREERLREGDAALTDRWHPVTANEVHALVLGAALGLIAGQTGRDRLTVIAAGYAVWRPPRGERSIGSKTLTHEPWWTLAGVVAGVVAGRVVFDERHEPSDRAVELLGSE